MLISLEVAAEGAVGLGGGRRGPKVALGAPAWDVHSHVCLFLGQKDLLRSAAVGCMSIPGTLGEI